MTNKNICIVGAGFSGAVIARELAQNGYHVTVFDERNHVAGNCHTKRDDATGIMIHEYGPHIFHTSNEHVWNYIQQFDRFHTFVNRVKAIYNGHVYSLPINLLTINTFFEKTFNPQQAAEFIESLGDKSIVNPQTFEEQALRFVGKELYEAFFKGYTQKQWGVSPSTLPASILKRLPVRYNYDDNYYSSKYQGIPENGYTYIVNKILDHNNIQLKLASKYTRTQTNDYLHVFYSGPIDAWFNFSLGRLSYRTLDFHKEQHDGDFQGNPVINYSDLDVPWTRISEHKHFTPWEHHEKTIIFKEYSRSCGESDIPYYPIRLMNDKSLLASYIELAQRECGVSFVGRLGTYRYLDMHITIDEALKAASDFIIMHGSGQTIPSFFVDPT